MITSMDRNYYIQIRNRYHPENVKLIFILESPPISGKYFYDSEGAISEPLFSALMKLLNYQPKDKEDGLQFFKSEGYLLVDATYKQVNNLKGKERDETILSDYDYLVSDLENICSDKEVPIIIVKANVCKLLDHRLSEKGFNIINKGAIIPFPSHGQQNKFHTFALGILDGLKPYNVLPL
jgi:hypothetical protein